MEQNNVKEIPLTKGYVALVDDCDYDQLAIYNWHVLMTRNTVYAVRGVGPRGKQRAVLMHRTIMGPAAHLEVDHIDGDGVNNQRHNLRICTHQQNMQARRKHVPTASAFRGVSPLAARGKWVAYIFHNGAQRHIGVFQSEAAAAHAYDQRAKELFGDFARLNYGSP